MYDKMLINVENSGVRKRGTKGEQDCRWGLDDVTSVWAEGSKPREWPRPPAERNSAAFPRPIQRCPCCCDWCDLATRLIGSGGVRGDWSSPGGTIAVPEALEGSIDEAPSVTEGLPEVRRKRHLLRRVLLLLRQVLHLLLRLHRGLHRWPVAELRTRAKSNWCRWMVEVDWVIGWVRVGPAHQERQIVPCPAPRWLETVRKMTPSTTCRLVGSHRGYWLYLLHK